MRLKTRKPAPKKRSSASGAILSNKLISIRIPEKMIEGLRRLAEEKGEGMGYQQLIKAYIKSGMSGEGSETFQEEMEAIATPVLKSVPAKKKVVPVKVPSVMREDIEALGKIFKPYLEHFSGKTFLITGAFGFLGRYMVHLLHHLNQEYRSE